MGNKGEGDLFHLEMDEGNLVDLEEDEQKDDLDDLVDLEEDKHEVNLEEDKHKVELVDNEHEVCAHTKFVKCPILNVGI